MVYDFAGSNLTDSSALAGCIEDEEERSDTWSRNYCDCACDGNQIRVTLDGKIYGTYSLSKDQTIEVKDGDFYNRIRIEDGKAYMEEANCPDGYCEEQGKISGHTQTIVCLPHKLVVEILENENDQSFGTSDPEDVAPDTIAK